MPLITERVEAARRGDNPKVIRRMPSGWAVIGDAQFLEGYCLLLPDPVVPTLNDLKGDARAAFLRDMAILGDAILEVTGAVRINYEMLGNLEPELHAHCFPRFDTEDHSLRTKPVWFYDWENAPKFDPDQHRPLMQRIREALDHRMD